MKKLWLILAVLVFACTGVFAQMGQEFEQFYKEAKFEREILFQYGRQVGKLNGLKEAREDLTDIIEPVIETYDDFFVAVWMERLEEHPRQFKIFRDPLKSLYQSWKSLAQANKSVAQEAGKIIRETIYFGEDPLESLTFQKIVAKIYESSTDLDEEEKEILDFSSDLKGEVVLLKTEDKTEGFYNSKS